MEDDRLNALERLADLKQSGALTDDEAQTEKRRILSSDAGSGTSSPISALPPSDDHKGQTTPAWTENLWHRVDPSDYSGSSRVAIWTSIRIQGYGILSIVVAFIFAIVVLAQDLGEQGWFITFTCLIQGLAMVMIATYIQVRVASAKKLELLLEELVTNTTPR
jgi:hypothetical protein